MATIREKKPQSSSNDKGYEVFLRGLELISIGMKSCSSNVDRWALLRAIHQNKKPARKFREEYKLADFEEEHFDCEGRFTVTIVDPTAPDQALLAVEVVFEAHLHGKRPIQKSFADRFAKSDFRLLVLPYARYAVSNVTAQMSVPPVVIPLATNGSDE